MRWNRPLSFVVYVWELAQVELHGNLSADRIKKLRTFLDQTSFTKALLVCVGFPIPCVLILAALEAIPMAPLDAGTVANYAFWLRLVLTWAALSPGGLSIFQSFLPELIISRAATLVLSILGGLTSGGVAFAFSFLIGFPVPFALLVSIPGWFIAITPPTIFIYITRLRHDSALLWRFIRCWLMLIILALTVLVFPFYIFGFNQLGPMGQIFYVGMLPLIKLSSRNGMSWLIGDFYDVKAGIVIFNIEVCSALYMAVVMQNSAKLTTTFAVLAVDVIQSKVAIIDIDKMLKTANHSLASSGLQVSSSYPLLVFNQVDDSTPSEVSTRWDTPSNALIYNHISASSESTKHVSPLASKVARIHPTPGFQHFKQDICDNGETGSQRVLGIIPAVPTNVLSMPTNLLSIKDQKVLAVNSARVLFTAEFVLLGKYVEAMMPAIHAAFVALAVNLGNREHYSQLDTITHNTILNVIVYCLLKILSFCVMCFLLSRKLGISAVHLVASALVQQWDAVFSRTLLWVVYTTLTSLRHSGPDFTFQFVWLRKSSATT